MAKAEFATGHPPQTPEINKRPMETRYSVVQYLGVLKVNLWEYKGNILTQKGYRLPTLLLRINLQHQKSVPSNLPESNKPTEPAQSRAA